MVNFPRDYVWLIPALPLLGALINGLLAFVRVRLPKSIVAFVACSVMVLAFAMSVMAVCEVIRIPDDVPKFFVNRLYTWVHVGNFSVDLAFLMDPLSSVMIL